MANQRGPNTGARALILRMLQNAGGGFVTERLLYAATGIPEGSSTLRTHLTRLRIRGHNIVRVFDVAGAGYRLVGQVYPLRLAA